MISTNMTQNETGELVKWKKKCLHETYQMFFEHVQTRLSLALDRNLICHNLGWCGRGGSLKLLNCLHFFDMKCYELNKCVVFGASWNGKVLRGIRLFNLWIQHCECPQTLHFCAHTSVGASRDDVKYSIILHAVVITSECWWLKAGCCACEVCRMVALVSALTHFIVRRNVERKAWPWIPTTTTFFLLAAHYTSSHIPMAAYLYVCVCVCVGGGRWKAFLS